MVPGFCVAVFKTTAPTVEGAVEKTEAMSHRYVVKEDEVEPMKLAMLAAAISANTPSYIGQFRFDVMVFDLRKEKS